MHAPRPAAVTDELHAGLDGVLLADVHGLTDRELLDATRDLYAAEARLAAAKARVIGEVDARVAHGIDGARTTSAWIRTACKQSTGTARHDVQVARSLRRLTAVADALADGDVGSHHAGLFASYHRDPRLADALERDQVVLVEEAVKLSWPHFVRVIAYWAQLQDPDGTDEDAEDRRANRKVHLSQTYEGSWVLDGVLDPVSGAVLAEALRRIERELFEADRAEAEKDGDPNPDVTRFARTPRQRRADALVELARRAMASPRGARLPAPLVTVLVGYETFAGRICELADGTVLAPSDVTALLDEAVIERVVFDGPSRVIDIGERRFFRAATRRAIEVRDRTCTHPYCDAPAHHCDVDHRRPASDGGSTTQDNGRLACPFHNHQRQRRGPPDW